MEGLRDRGSIPRASTKDHFTIRRKVVFFIGFTAFSLHL